VLNIILYRRWRSYVYIFGLNISSLAGAHYFLIIDWLGGKIKYRNYSCLLLKGVLLCIIERSMVNTLFKGMLHMSKAKILLCTALLFPLSHFAYAADPAKLTDQQGLITFTGELTDETCEISGNKNFTVILPKLSTSTLKASGSEAGSKEFMISVKNCSSGLKNIAVHFEAVGGSDKDSVTGNLKNSVVGTNNVASNVQVRLYQEQKQIRLGETAKPVALVNSAANMSFASGYYATGPATSGLIEAKAIYTIAYP